MGSTTDRTHKIEMFLKRPLKCTFVSANEFKQALTTSTSVQYFNNMGAADLLARNVSSKEECRLQYIASFIPKEHIPQPHLAKLRDLLLSCDQACEGSKDDILRMLPSIEWRFSILQDGLEGGMPHTHADMICLPLNVLSEVMDPSKHTVTVQMLIHEKLHVLQRLRKDVTQQWISDQGYKILMERAQLPLSISTYARSNPDLDEFIYVRPNKCATVFVLDADPTSLSKTRPVCVSLEHNPDDMLEQYEHPNEMMAYKLSIQATQEAV